MGEEDIIAFIRAYLGSVYTLELLLLVKRDPKRAWTPDDLVRELRSSRTAVAGALNRLVHAGLVVRDAASGYVYAPTSPALERLAAEIERVYSIRPISVAQAIAAAPDEKLRAFSDAFKLKE